MTDTKLETIADRIVELKRFSETTGTKTHKTQGALLSGLDPIEMIHVCHLVNKKLFNPEARNVPAAKV